MTLVDPSPEMIGQFPARVITAWLTEVIYVGLQAERVPSSPLHQRISECSLPSLDRCRGHRVG
jgi:hypothetical protein